MPIPFHLEERLAGFCGNTAKKGESVDVIFRGLLGPADPDLSERLNELQRCLFSKIPGFPNPPKISHLAIIINRDLGGEAHIDDFKVTAQAKPTRAIAAGETVYVKDIADIESVDFGIKIPNDCAVVIVQSFGWKRSLFFDFGPLLEKVGPRDYPIEKALAQQQLLLLGLSAAQPMFGTGEKRLNKMRAAVAQLEKLLIAKCEAESEYQELLAQNPWMIGALYSQFLRHANMDDRRIPDFTALRAYDQCHDIVELKQPFLPLFRKDGTFSADFNDSWNQAERYLEFCQRQRAYLNDEKGLRFDNPRCLLLMGNNPSNAEMKSFRRKQDMIRLVTILTYDQLLAQARHVFELVAAAGEMVAPI